MISIVSIVALASRHARGHLLLTGIVFLVLTAIGGAFDSFTPDIKNIDGIRSNIIGLELVRDTAEVTDILGANPNEPTSKAIRSRVEFILWLDMLFILAFTGLSIQLGFVTFNKRGLSEPSLRNYVFIVILAAVFDYLENFCLYEITTASDPDWPAYIDYLIIFTYTKWVLLGIGFFWLGGSLFRTGHKALGLVALLALPLAITGIWHRPALEWQTIPMGLVWVLGWVRFGILKAP